MNNDKTRIDTDLIAWALGWFLVGLAIPPTVKLLIELFVNLSPGLLP